MTCNFRYFASITAPRKRIFLLQPQREFSITPAFLNRKKKSSPPPGDQQRGYFLLFFPITTFGLGCWQVYRRRWKLGLIEELEARSNVRLEDLPELEEMRRKEYCNVRLKGKFDHNREVLITPRMPLESTLHSQAGSGLISAGIKVGAHVVTPFLVTDGKYAGQEILVNRGWVAKTKAAVEKRVRGQVEGEIELEGRIRSSERSSYFVHPNDPERGLWLRRDVDELSEALGTLPIFIDADIKSTIPGGPLGGQTHVQLRNEHLRYIITWWSLSAISAALWYRKYVSRVRFLR